MLDLHAHVLPALDDGARDLEESLAMLRAAVADGTTVLCATPHALGPMYDVDRARAEAAVEALRTAAAAAGIAIDLRLGGEVWYRTDLDALARAGRLPTFSPPSAPAGRRYVLIEFPPTHVPPEASEVLFNLRLEGVTPVIAHPERNPSFWHRPADAVALRAQGALLQVTAGALTGAFRDDARDCAKALAKAGAIDLLASDCHHADRRPPGLASARKVLEKWAGRAVAARATETLPAALLAGAAVPGAA
ncbi:MAG: CpsB/CapC family capsule biosynthesis tyrosine phosphatase [Planctomycetota bacterium]